MTVSHIFFDGLIYEADVNNEVYKKDPTLNPTYDVNSTGFKELIQAVILGTEAEFAYEPSDDEIR
jgi:hypothetical protein